jgi:hypothetical protein
MKCFVGNYPYYSSHIYLNPIKYMNKITSITFSLIIAAIGVFSVINITPNVANAASTYYFPNSDTTCVLHQGVCVPGSYRTAVERYTYAQPAVVTTQPPVVIPPVVVTPAVVTNPVNVVNNNTNNNNVYVNGGGYNGGTSYPVYINTPPTYIYPTYQPAPVYSSYYDYPNYSYSQPTYYQNYYVEPISVACSANTNFAPVGAQVVWTARASGGTGSYNYSWAGTQGLYGSGPQTAIVYNVPGRMIASVTVTSGGRSTQVYCSELTVGARVVYQPAPQQPIYSQGPIADIACYPSQSKIRVGQAVTWTLEIRGGVPPFRLAWSGTNALSGNQPSIAKIYSTSGMKSASITITAADGSVSTRACGVVTVSSNAVATTVTTAPPLQFPPAVVAQEQMTANSVFTMGNVPWGWVAFMIIFVLIVIILYLTYNRYKI